jgi:hypothetical protein
MHPPFLDACMHALLVEMRCNENETMDGLEQKQDVGISKTDR